MVNGAFFVPSGEGLEEIYDKASSTDPKSSALVDVLTQNAGVLGDPRYHLTLSHKALVEFWEISLGRVDPGYPTWARVRTPPARLFILLYAALLTFVTFLQRPSSGPGPTPHAGVPESAAPA